VWFTSPLDCSVDLSTWDLSCLQQTVQTLNFFQRRRSCNRRLNQHINGSAAMCYFSAGITLTAVVNKNNTTI